ncbi:MAG: hypothetical protein HZA01_05635 [Nitrospinae bacterium]|nr:hypothetical protein [Nitrospinota bacterium]
MPSKLFFILGAIFSFLSVAIGAITPIGGAAFLLGWLLLAWSVWRG